MTGNEDHVMSESEMESVANISTIPPPPQDLGETPKSTNPFLGGSFKTGPDLQPESAPVFPYLPTTVPQQQLRGFPYKTSNRIFDDMRFTPGFLALRSDSDVTSLLNSRPIAYKHAVAGNAHGLDHTSLILNNPLAHAPSVSRIEHAKDGVSVSIVRGLIVDKTRKQVPESHKKTGPQHRVVGHFKVQILTSLQASNPRSADKNQYHLIPREMVSVDDLNMLNDLSTRGDSVLDDAFYKCLNSVSNHILRVTVYSPEFSGDDLASLSDPDIVKERYLKYIKKNPDAGLSPESVPGPVSCFQTLIKVLKGPVLLPPEEATHTISRKKTNLDAKIDVQLLFRELGFASGEDADSLIPPNLSEPSHFALKESYIRKATELIFLGKSLKTYGRPNDFDLSFSFSDNLSQVHSILSEVDKHMSLTMAWGDVSNKYADYIALSSYSFFQDELIIRCYEHTVNSDPQNKMHYVDSFAQLVKLRTNNGSARLSSYYYNQFSKGLMYGCSDYLSALSALGIEGVSNDDIVDEDAVLELYKAACKQDPKNYTYFSKQLRTICGIRNSPVIEKFMREELVPQVVALDELRIEDLTEDEVVITAYEFRLDEVMQSVNFNADSAEVSFLQKCLLSIAVVRKSYILMTYIDMHMPDLSKPTKELSLAEAFSLLSANDTTTDFDIISNFQELLMQSSYGDEVDIRGLRVALETLARRRSSEILSSFLQNGKVDESLLPAENWPAGLDNIGNTCYLNSLLQYYFSIKPLRDFILNFDEKNIDLSKNISRKIGGRLVEETEVGRAVQFIYRLQELFNEMITTDKRFIQPSKELVYLSFLPLSQLVVFEDQIKQQVESDTEMEDCTSEKIDTEDLKVDKDPFSDSEAPISSSRDENSNLIEFSSSESEAPKSRSSNIGDQISKDENTQTKIMKIGSEQIESAIEIGRQQDVTECIENVTFQVETAIEPEYLEDDGEQYDLIKRLFSGRTKQTITPLEHDAPPRVSFERFFSLIINVGDHPRDIYDALDNYFGENVVNLEEGKVKMSATISKTPEILQFHVQRVLFDRERLMAYKSLEVIPFGENIYLDRYLDTDDAEVLSKRQEVFEWKTEISKLFGEKQAIIQVDTETKLSAIDSLNATLKYLNSRILEHEELQIKQETIDAIQHQVELLKIRLQSINTRIENLQEKISRQFRDYKKFGYSLFAVFIHRGEASYGHYWVYIKDPKKNIYRKYNDDTVTEVPASEVFNFTETNTATPYYMVFVKEELTEEYIEPLKRLIKC